MNQKKMIQQIREFNRYYTIWLDVMNKGYLGTDHTWTESRIIYELYVAEGTTAQQLCNHLHIDKGFMSRTLKGFEKEGLLERRADCQDKRERTLVLTDQGIQAAEDYCMKADMQVKEKIQHMNAEEGKKLCEAMQYIMEVLS